MNLHKYSDTITSTVTKLSEYESFKLLCHQHHDGEPYPSEKVLHEIIELCRAILFPGYYGHSNVNRRTITYYLGVNTEKLFELLSEQILAGLCFACDRSKYVSLEGMREKSVEKTAEFIAYLPELRKILTTDVIAAYNGDPAAESYGEVIFCYPAIRAISNHRIAHELLKLGVPLIPRMISEMAHSETGIDIHPAATIGNYFTIDHGTGVVIGATAIIGNNVKIYQGVTLGARSFPLDAEGNPIKGIPRHPIIEDNVIIYSNATILGRIVIGEGAIIGGNIWVTENVEPGDKVMQTRSRQTEKNK
ncbi:serine O-acetyltransferase [Coprobacter tertius]|uniref:Serine acetyltransferase n=1 Tax=Coprobacter tertius TaxID=2944915 RepID=A0ABT1MD52_9BACT|nr:serine acetyltransferase [Coprobacter tertius]MCP9610567.1 serine acetyltransferase [Coprobacter tertius]